MQCLDGTIFDISVQNQCSLFSHLTTYTYLSPMNQKARAQELNSYYSQSDRSYTTAISMTANEVNPIWLRSSMVKYQLNDINSAMDLMKRVENRFPEAPEVRAAYAVLLYAKGDEDAARKKFLEIPDRQGEKYWNVDYLDKVVAWPPKMKEGIGYLTKVVGDST